VAEPDAALLFKKDTAGMWEDLVKRLGRSEVPAGMNSI
jgi:hypothetical protein